MRSNLVDAWLGPLRTRWAALLTVVGLTLGSAVAATSLLVVLDNHGAAIINGSLVNDREPTVRTLVVLSMSSDQAQLRVTIPLLVALAWFIGLGTALRLLAGRALRTAWRRVRPARLAEWFALGALLAALTLLGLYASVAVAGHLGGALGGLTAALWTYGLARLALALPAMLVDGLRLPAAVRSAVVARRGHAATGALILLTVVAPAVAFLLLDPAIMPSGRTWVGDVLWSAVVPLLEYLILVATVPLQAAGLLTAYRAAYPDGPTSSPNDADPFSDPESSLAEGGEPGGPAGFAKDEHNLTVTVQEAAAPLLSAYDPTVWPATPPMREADAMTPSRRSREARDGQPSASRPSLRGLRVGAVALLSIGPAMVGPALILINPNGLPVATVAHPEAGFSSRPLAMAALTDGTVVSVGPTQAALCRDEHCTDLDLLTMPCVDGAAPAPVGAATRNCPTEGPLVAVDVTPDGTLLALVPDRDQGVRLFWCRLEPTDDGQCRWGGATTLYQQSDQWWNRSMAVTALPNGGFAAAIVTPVPGETRAPVRLITCERLDCPQPTVHTVPTYPRPADVGGLIDIAADPSSGTLAVGYVDRIDEALYLGGCPPGCPDGPTVTRIGRWPDLSPEASVPDRPALQVAASATGPAAVLRSIDARTARPAVDPAQGALTPLAAPAAIVVSCDDPGCTTSRRSLQSYPSKTVTLVTNQAGQVYVIGMSWPGNQLHAWPLTESYYYVSPLPPGPLVAAALGPDGRLRLLTADDQGPALVTLARW